ncbi:MAG: glycosyltransferase family 25 protein [Candidatus Rhabdochlamydia sp.]
MLKTAILFLILFSHAVHSGIEETFKKALYKPEIQRQLRNIDFIYMINLDERPEKYEHSLQQLAPYGIIPYRFSAVNGWNLPLEAINSIGIPYESWMRSGLWGTTYSITNDGNPFHEIMKEGTNYFCHCMSKGAIGCALSHLSVLQDAYDSGYETIWIMEDDIEVKRDPHILSDLMDELDALVGKEGWDILFTDQDTKGQDGKYVPCLGYAPRPNFSPSNPARFARKWNISRNLRSIGARYGTYSMIVRRSGMEKILNFIKNNHLFLPIDMENVLPDQIRLFTVINDVVSTLPRALSDNGGPNYLEKNE